MYSRMTHEKILISIRLSCTMRHWNLTIPYLGGIFFVPLWAFAFRFAETTRCQFDLWYFETTHGCKNVVCSQTFLITRNGHTKIAKGGVDICQPYTLYIVKKACKKAIGMLTLLYRISIWHWLISVAYMHDSTDFVSRCKKCFALGIICPITDDCVCVRFVSLAVSMLASTYCFPREYKSIISVTYSYTKVVCCIYTPIYIYIYFTLLNAF